MRRVIVIVAEGRKKRSVTVDQVWNWPQFITCCTWLYNNDDNNNNNGNGNNDGEDADGRDDDDDDEWSWNISLYMPR